MEKKLKSLQVEVTDKGIGNCHMDRGRIVPCGYHRDRAEISVHALAENLIMDKAELMMGWFPETTSFHELAVGFSAGGSPPAGGWFLVKEQRDWLRGSLVRILKSLRDPVLRVLEAGTASHNHHYTFETILHEALLEAGTDHTIELVVADQCLFPLLAIETMAELGLPKLLETKSMEIAGFSLTIDDSLLRLLADTQIWEFDRIVRKTLHADLMSPRELVQSGTFHLITEHFISAVINNSALLEEFRKTYAAILRPGGVLLCACGITLNRNREEYQWFREMHWDLGFQLKETEYVWDPYGMSREMVVKHLTGRPVETLMGNTMFRFDLSV